MLGPALPGITEAVIASGEAVLESVDKYRADGALINFLGDAVSAREVQDAWSPDNRDWLLRIKAEYDPRNMFSYGHSLT